MWQTWGMIGRPREWSTRLALAVSVAWMAAGWSACERKKTPLEEMNLTEDDAKRILAELSSHKTHATAPPARTLDGSAPTPADIVQQAVDPSLTQGQWVADGLVDVGPAAPSVASSKGVVLINGENELFLAELGRLPSSREPAETPIDELSGDHGRFALGRGPSIADGYAYWITSHYLMRRPLVAPHAPLEILAADARVGTRASALPASKEHGTWVAYVALPTVKDGPLRAKLWYGQEHEAILTEPGTSTLSVRLVERQGRAYALMLEARTGQSSLHVRNIETDDPPKPGTDRVLWVGGSPHSTTELGVFGSTQPSSAAGIIGLLPLEQDITHFGLATVSFSSLEASAEPHVHWIPYANGINPAPVDSAEVCGKGVVLFARPSGSEPGSPQELVFAELGAGRPEAGLVLSRSKAFYDVSIAPLQRAALVSYVADHRTWARSVRCVKR